MEFTAEIVDTVWGMEVSYGRRASPTANVLRSSYGTV
jgi:hypothetical protein